MECSKTPYPIYSLELRLPRRIFTSLHRNECQPTNLLGVHVPSSVRPQRHIGSPFFPIRQNQFSVVILGVPQTGGLLPSGAGKDILQSITFHRNATVRHFCPNTPIFSRWGEYRFLLSSAGHVVVSPMASSGGLQRIQAMVVPARRTEPEAVGLADHHLSGRAGEFIVPWKTGYGFITESNSNLVPESLAPGI